MDYQLIVVQGRSASTTLRLGDGVTVVGRHDACQLRIKSSQVSRKHCEIFEKKGLLLVKDLGSSNGTYVNGKRVKEQRVLEPGDELMIGQVRLRVTKLGEPEPVGATPGSGAGKPSDTAVAAPADAGEDDFVIEFDESLDDAAVDLMKDDDLGLAADDINLSDTPTPEAPPQTEVKSKAKAAPEPEPKTEPHPPADDAVADFLLDLKLDDD